MIVVTGAAGFIGSHLIGKLNEENFKNIIGVDHFDNELKNQNLKDKTILASIDRDSFIPWLEENAEGIEFIFHMGARADTTEQDVALLRRLNTDYTKSIWKICVSEQIPLIYASSAATYGNGKHGFSDELSLIPKLKPLNAYAQSKHAFDLWALAQTEKPFYWAGLKFFNVYGPNEGHKGKMASMVYQMEQQIRSEGKVRLFKSYRDDYAHGEQKRDFIHVDEVVNNMYNLMLSRVNSGVFNVGTGKARSFNEMAYSLFDSAGLKPFIEYIDMPEDLRDKYQYFTEAGVSH